MNIKPLFIAAVALILGLSACNKRESLSQDGLSVCALRITAVVGKPFVATRFNPLGTPEKQGKFINGDKILVGRSFTCRLRNDLIYKFDGTNWIPNDNKYLLWDEDLQSFNASYPLDENNYAILEVQQDQSTLEQIALSDLMSANIFDAHRDQVLNFVMERQTSRIIIKIAGFKSEFPADSKVTNLKIMVKDYYLLENYFDFIPYVQGNGSIGSSYTLLSGGTLMPREKYVSLKVGQKEMRTGRLPEMEIGMSYTINLIVDKENLEIGSITVADWSSDEIIPGGQAVESRGGCVMCSEVCDNNKLARSI